MGRRRIPMALIEKERTRKTTFEKRKSGLIKKVHEFSTLCGVDVCLIIYPPNFDGQELAEPETWPRDTREVKRIIHKYYNTTSDRRPKVYDVQEYYKERVKKVEGEISKVRKETLKILYPTWDDSLKTLGEEQLKMFVSMLDGKLNECNQRINMLKGDVEGTAIVEYNDLQVEKLSPYLASNPNSHFNLMQNMTQPQFFPPPMNISDPLPFWPIQLGENSQNPMLHFGQNGMTDWVNYQVGDVGMAKEDEAGNNHNSSPQYYYDGNTQIVQSYPTVLETLPLQTLPSLPLPLEYQTQTNQPPEFHPNGSYDANILQDNVFNDMHGRK